MKIWTLIENTTDRNDLATEHGLSLYIETNTHKILFDAGQSGAFADNAEKLGVDLGQVDFAVLSHGHYDHSGGLARFWACNSTASVYVNEHAFEPHYNAENKLIGVDASLTQSSQLVRVGDQYTIAPGVTLLTCNARERLVPIDCAGLQMDVNGVLQPDDFRHEQYLLIEEDGKKILFSGCSHKGILNITHWFQPNVLIGGFHFMKLPPDSPTLDDAATQLLQYPTRYYTGHCTGLPQFQRLQTLMGDRLVYLSAGTVVEV